MSALLRGFVYGLLVVNAVLLTSAVNIWFERKFSARMQSRVGPTRVGPLGLLQPFADVAKLMSKEDTVPASGNRVLFTAAPLLATVCALAAAAVVPFTPDVVAADLDVGVLWVLAVGSITTIAIFMAGWASNNKFALLGGMRSIAQAVSYEVPLVLSAMVPVVLSGTMSLSGIVTWQSEHLWIAAWPLIPGLPAFVIFFLAMTAEANRIPFDIPEAESELVAGVTTEYSGMKFALFYVGEYAHTLVGSAIASALFLGGWSGPMAATMPWLGLVYMVVKTLFLFFMITWVRWSLVRFRSDQLLAICWKWLVPISVGLVLVAALWVELVPGVH
ncbi:MAG: NADH-quinone oxidoreductase subunit NuoH [Sandaracinaceae bacterium]|nr:NADH-quinone oxidoreductase subunit NuoH [Sandaracinaceae bacterium]